MCRCPQRSSIIGAAAAPAVAGGVAGGQSAPGSAAKVESGGGAATKPLKSIAYVEKPGLAVKIFAARSGVVGVPQNANCSPPSQYVHFVQAVPLSVTLELDAFAGGALQNGDCWQNCGSGLMDVLVHPKCDASAPPIAAYHPVGCRSQRRIC